MGNFGVFKWRGAVFDFVPAITLLWCVFLGLLILWPFTMLTAPWWANSIAIMCFGAVSMLRDWASQNLSLLSYKERQ